MKISRRTGMRLIYGSGVLLTIVLVFWWWSRQLPRVSSGMAEKPPQPHFQIHWMVGEAVLKSERTSIVESLVDGSRIFEGGALRTFEYTHVVLNSLQSKDKIELGPDSEVWIERAVPVPLIHVHRGELFFSIQGDGKEPWAIRFSGGEVRASNADFVLRSDGGTPTLEVYRGIVTAEDGVVVEKDQIRTLGGKSKTNSFAFQMLTPFQNDRVFHSEDGRFRTRFAWANLDTDARVELYLGPSRKEMVPVTIERSTSRPNEFSLLLPEGVHYWQLKAMERVGRRDKKWSEKWSPVYKIFVIEERPVQILEPQGPYNGQTARRLGGVFFRWANPSRLERLLLEVARDTTFDSPMIRQPLSTGGSQLVKVDGTGKFYWRINGFRHDSSEFVSSSIGYFEIQESATEPDLIFPTQGAQLTQRALRQGQAVVSWKGAGPSVYKVEVVQKPEGKSVWSQETAGNNVILPDLKKGKYTVRVAVVGGGAPSEREITVVTADLLNWSVANGFQDRMVMVSELKWSPGPTGTSVYRLQVRSIFPVQVASHVSKDLLLGDLSWRVDLPEEGVFTAVVQALDSDERVIAESPAIAFQSLAEE